ncbi:ribose-phosphate diphosphokinase [Candidatus Dependentiae bacterium]
MENNSVFFALDKDFDLAKKLAEKCNKSLIIPEVVYFADSEIRIDLPEGIDLEGKQAFIVHSTVEPVNDNYMQLFFLADLLKRRGASQVKAVIPYFGYSRQCGCKTGEDVGHAQVIAKLLEASGVDSVVSVEIHDNALKHFFSIPFENILLRDFIAKNLKELLPSYKNWCLVAPDDGAQERVKEVANLLGIDTILFSKQRTGIDKVAISQTYVGACEGKNAIILDDIIDTGGTAVKVANKLSEHGANKIYGYFVHPVISNEAVQRLEKSPIDKFFVTNSVALHENKKIGKIEVLDISSVISEFLKNCKN